MYIYRIQGVQSQEVDRVLTLTLLFTSERNIKVHPSKTLHSAKTKVDLVFHAFKQNALQHVFYINVWGKKYGNWYRDSSSSAERGRTLD